MTDIIGGVVFAAGTWLVMTKIVIPRVPSLQRRPVRDPALRGQDPGRPAQAVPADEEEEEEEEAAASR